MHGNHWKAQSIFNSFLPNGGFKNYLGLTIVWQQTTRSKNSLSSWGELSVSVQCQWSGHEERVWNDSVMNLPSDSCQLTGGLAKALSVMDSTRTEEAFALWLLKDGWWWIEMTPNAVEYIRAYKHSWAVSKLLVGLNDFPLNRCS